MKAAIAQTEECFGAINGVIHGAGNTSADAFLPSGRVDRPIVEGHFLPKAHGAIILEDLLRGRPIDFYLMLSSISGVLGGLGLLPYASANLFLDTFTAQANQVGSTRWISANWDAWQFPADEQFFKRSVHNWTEYILPKEGSDAFLRILESVTGQVVISTTSLEQRLRKWVKLESLRDMQSGGVQSVSLHPRPNLSSQYVAPRTPVEQTVVAAWENLLGVAPIGIHDKFFELGGHSLLAIQLISRMRDAFQVELPPQRLFEAPTVAQFAAVIEADMKAAKERQAQQEEERIAELLDLIEGLSEEEVAAMLANPGPLGAGAAHG
jgi:acyl carrier protein